MTPWPLAAVEGDISESVMITRRNSKTHFLAGCVISIVLDKYDAADWDCAALCLSLSLSDSSWYNKINQIVDPSLLGLAIHVVYSIRMYLVLHPLLTQKWSILQGRYKFCRLLNPRPHYQTVSYRTSSSIDRNGKLKISRENEWASRYLTFSITITDYWHNNLFFLACALHQRFFNYQ